MRRERIRAVFLHREDSYDLAEASRLTGVSVAKLRRDAKRHDRDAVKVDGAWRFTWSQLVCIALDRWTWGEIHEALGDDAGRVLPPLLALRTVTVRLPEFVIRALETYAANDGTTLDHYLYGELIDFAGMASDHLGRRIPGFQDAYLFPGHE